MAYQERTIRKASGGFGQYQQSMDHSGEIWDILPDLLSECEDNVSAKIYELGADDLPEGLEDIRGKIRDQDGRIYAYLSEGDQDIPCYFAIVDVDACENCALHPGCDSIATTTRECKPGAYQKSFGGTVSLCAECAAAHDESAANGIDCDEA